MRRSFLLLLSALPLGIAACGDGPPTGPPPAELKVPVMYITQATQNRDGSVPLVAGRDGYLRVFLVADQPSTTAPPVRVRVYHGDVLRETLVIPPPALSVPTAVNQGDLNSSWNVKLAGALIQPGLRVQAEADLENGVSETRAMNVVALAPLRIRFVPIRQTDNGLTGRVSEANKDQFLVMTRKILPIPGYDADVRAPYSVRFLEIDPQGNSWRVLVSELDAVRVAEGSNRYYYGVVQTPYTGGGVVGIAAGLGSRTSLGYDRFPDADPTVAHELGHNWGRRHVPACGPAGVDPQYPYSSGQIGVFGMDVETGELKAPSANTDIMGYCAENVWISDYTYDNIFTYRAINDRVSTTVQPSLLVWGRVQDGELVLEPAFQVTTRPSLPAAPGPFRIEGRDASGAVLFSHSFLAEQIPDVPGDQRTFAFAIPLSPERVTQLAMLRLTGNGRQVERRSVNVRADKGRALLQSVPVATQRVSRDKIFLRMDRENHAMAMVRDPQTGEILSLVRDGTASLQTTAAELEVTVSDGIRSTAKRLRVPGH